MNEISQRLRRAVEFLRGSGYARTDSDVAERLGVTNSTLSMTTTGTRTPTWDLLLRFCDIYPISFQWLRTGEGPMIKGEREAVLLRRIEELEKELAKYKDL